MPFRFAPLGGILAGLALLLTAEGCKQSRPSSDAPSDSSTTPAQRADPAPAAEAADSLGAALSRFEAAAAPTPADSIHLRRWADSVQKRGNEIRGRRPDSAQMLLQAVLQAYRSLSDSTGVAEATDGIGVIHYYQGQYEQALARHLESLRISRQINDTDGIAGALNNAGIVHWTQNQYGEALTRYEEALALYRKIGDREGVARILNNVGIIQRNRGRYEEALTRYRRSLEIKRELGNRGGIAKTLNNIGEVYRDQARGQEALRQYREALDLNRELGHQVSAALNLRNVGDVHLTQGRLRAATDTLRRALRLAETLRRRATSPEARRSLLSSQIEIYQSLTTVHVRSGHPDSALRSVEQARARLLTDRLADAATSDTTFTLPSVAKLRRTLGPDEAALLYANAESAWPLTALVVTRDTTYARELPDSTVRATIGTEYQTRLARLRRDEGPLTVATGPGASSGQDKAPSLVETIRLYRSFLTREQTDASIRSDLSQRLYSLLVGPVANLIDGKSELIAVPTGTLGYLPLETLQDAEGRHLVEDKRVRYAQSLTVLHQLQQRDHPEPERSLLALGGATYELDPSTGGDVPVAEARRGTSRVATEGHASILLRNASRRMERGRSPRRAYQQLGYDRWPRLFGTKLEVQKLKRAVGGEARLLTGPSASEEQVRRLSATGRLSRYRHVHFATHGVAVPEVPALSALVLSQEGASDSLAARDGYLAMREIADLKLQADVAVLSACQTGLGKVVAGEGVVSLSHAFLRAGANATLVSQWRVSDWSTQQFMAAVYRTAGEEGTSFAEATAEVKRAFISGKFGEKNTDPLRWAPFVYYGKK